MKATEHKFKQTMLFAAVPGFLRHLADAIEKRSDPVPAEWSDLPAPISKLSVKGKRCGNHWEMKVKLKAEVPPTPPSADSDKARDNRARLVDDRPAAPYRDLKKRMKVSFKAISGAVENQRFPDDGTMRAFLTDSEHMTAFSGRQYGEEYYPSYREACRKLARAFDKRDWQAFATGYATLDQMKKDCHKRCK